MAQTDLELLKNRVENADAGDFVLILKDCSNLPEFMEGCLTDEQWDAIRQMLIDSIDKKIKTLQECTTSDEI